MTALWGAVALLVTGITLSELLRREAERGFDERLEADLVALVRAAAARPGGAAAVPPEVLGPRFREPLSGYAWQIRAGGRIIAQSESLGPLVAGVAEPLDAPIGRPGDLLVSDVAPARGMAREVRLSAEGGPILFAVARPRAEIDAGIAYLRRLLLWALGVFALAMFIGGLIVARLTLAPIHRLGEAVRALREEGTLPAGGRWPAELAPVVEELAALSEHITRLVARSRAQAADLAHALKTPLSVVRQRAEAAGDAATLAELDRVERRLDWHLTRRRLAGAGRGATPVRPAAEAVVFALSRLFAARALDFDLGVPEDLRFRGDEEDLQEMLGNLVENACKFARSRVRVTAAAADGRLLLRVEDDGPGIPPEAAEAVFRRGVRLDETRPGHGQGLAIVREIAELYGGAARVGRSLLGGAAVELELPGDGRGGPR